MCQSWGTKLTLLPRNLSRFTIMTLTLKMTSACIFDALHFLQSDNQLNLNKSREVRHDALGPWECWIRQESPKCGSSSSWMPNARKVLVLQWTRIGGTGPDKDHVSSRAHQAQNCHMIIIATSWLLIHFGNEYGRLVKQQSRQLNTIGMAQACCPHMDIYGQGLLAVLKNPSQAVALFLDTVRSQFFAAIALFTGGSDGPCQLIHPPRTKKLLSKGIGKFMVQHRTGMIPRLSTRQRQTFSGPLHHNPNSENSRTQGL